MTHLFCYDISNPKRLHKCAKILEKYGLRIQKSFFQCELPPKTVEKIKKELLSIINKKTDSLFIYPICDKCGQKIIETGNGNVLKIESFEIL